MNLRQFSTLEGLAKGSNVPQGFVIEWPKLAIHLAAILLVHTQDAAGDPAMQMKISI
jgi:hypothetical protein